MESYEIILEGRVQGVGYRHFAVNHARVLSIVGCIKNLFDGRVKVIAQGNEGNLQHFIAQLHQGPRMAHVTDIHKDLYVGDEKFTTFSVRY